MEPWGTLVVSVGLGCTTLPIRLNCDPEIIVCKIVRAPRRAVMRRWTTQLT